MDDRFLFKAKTACIVGTSVFPKKEGEWVKGYDILRFSGSQIYENPFKCANDIFDYLLAKEVRS